MAAATLAVLSIPLAASPAHAAPTFFTIGSISPFTLNPGASKTFTVTVTNGKSPNSEAAAAPMTATLVVAKSGQSQSTDFTVGAVATTGGCAANTTNGLCAFSFPTGADDEAVSLKFQVTAAATVDVPAGTSAAFSGSSVVVSDGTSSHDDSSGFTVTLNGPAPPKPAKITGDVYDITTGQPVSNALVDLQDTANHSYTTRTNSKGQFQYIDQPPTPIAAGTIYIGATKSGFQPLVGQGQVFKTGTDLAYGRLRIRPVAAPTVSATTPTPTLSSAPPSTPDSGAPSGSGSVAAIGTGGGGNAAATGGLGGMFQFILIGGVALIVGGIIVVAYMFFKRRRDDLGGDPLDDPDGDDDGGGGYGVPSYDRPPPPRRVMPEPTMVVRPRIADAPTMMHAPAGGYQSPAQRAPVDPYQQEYSPAGYPPPRGPSYDPNFPASGQGGAYGSPPRSPYPEQGYGQPYGQPAYPPPAGYGSPGSPGGYAPDAGYGSSGGYGGQHGSSGGYGGSGGSYGSSGGYGGDQGGYGSSGGYGGGQHGSAGGYDQGYQSQPGYDHRGYSDQGHDNQSYDNQSYDNQGYGGGGGGYDQGYQSQPGYGGGGGGYDQRGYNSGGYDQNGYDQNGYDQNGYDANGYNSEGYHVNGYSQYPGEYDARSSAPPSSPSGYRGGYVPPEQRGNVDWLDD